MRRLHSLEVKVRPNCLGRSCYPPTQRPERQLSHTHEPPCIHTNGFGVAITFSNSLISHAAITQPEHRILVRRTGLETQSKMS